MRLGLVALGLTLAGCGGDPETDLEALLDAHERAQPRLRKTLRLVHELVEGEGRARLVTLIRREPFGYREEFIPILPAGPRKVRVSDGRHAWVPRGNGPGEPLRGEEARRFLVTAYVDGGLWLERRFEATRREAAILPKRDGLPGSFPASRRVLQVDVQTPAALAIRLQIDAEGHRLLGYAEPPLEPETWTRLGDWQERGGLWLPGTQVRGWEGPPRRLTYRLTETQTDLPLDPALFAGHPLPRGATDGGPLRVVAATLPGCAWILAEQVAIDGRAAGPALVDTGATSSVVAPELADTLQLPLGAAFSGGAFTDRARGHKRWIDSLQWGERRALQVTTLAGRSEPFPELLRAQAPHFVLGGDELLDSAPILDFAAGRLRHRGAPVPPLRASAKGDVVEVEAQRRVGSPCFYVTLRVRGVPLRTLVDSGYLGALHLTGRGADLCGVPRRPQAAPPGAMPPFAVEVGGLGGGRRFDLCMKLEGVELGALRFDGVWTLVQMQDGPEDEKRSYEALLGGGALLAFPRVGFDTPRAVLEIELPAGLRRDAAGRVRVPGPGEFCGALLAATVEDSPPRVTAVIPHSPAVRGGLQVGDRVATIADQAVSSQELPAVARKLWLRSGEEVALNVLAPGSSAPRRVVLRAH
jgi:hypothetical protein